MQSRTIYCKESPNCPDSFSQTVCLLLFFPLELLLPPMTWRTIRLWSYVSAAVAAVVVRAVVVAAAM